MVGEAGNDSGSVSYSLLFHWKEKKNGRIQTFTVCIVSKDRLPINNTSIILQYLYPSTVLIVGFRTVDSYDCHNCCKDDQLLKSLKMTRKESSHGRPWEATYYSSWFQMIAIFSC